MVTAVYFRLKPAPVRAQVPSGLTAGCAPLVRLCHVNSGAGGLFGRHSADATRWPGGRGGGRLRPGHRPGWFHLNCGLLRDGYGEAASARESVRVRVSSTVLSESRGSPSPVEESAR